VLHVQRVVAGEQLAANDRAEGLRIDLRTEAGSDLLRRGVSLFGSNSPVLDREVRAVAGGVDVLDGLALLRGRRSG